MHWVYHEHPQTPDEEGRSSMRRSLKRYVLLLYATLAAVCVPADCAPEAILGSQFADAYAAFAPLYSLYQSYADYLCQGTPVDVPPGLDAACTRFAYALAQFHVQYAVQTESSTATGIAYLARLRSDTATFCEVYGPDIQAVVESDGRDQAVLHDASAAGLFAGIKQVNDGIEATLDQILAGMGEGIERWAFAVAFSMRTILASAPPTRIEPSVREILYADPEGSVPPYPVPPKVGAAMQQLLDRSGQDLSDAESSEAIRAATTIYEYVLAEL